MMNILLFAGLAERVGASSVQLDVNPPVKVSELKRAFVAKYPEAEEQVLSCFAAVNQGFADDDAVIRSGDEVAFLPPVSGG